MGMKIIKFIDNFIYRVLVLICLIALGIGSYALYDTYHVYNHAQDKSVLKFKPQTESGVPQEAQTPVGYVAWISIPDTKIDYPIMQGSDNSEYLNKDPYGKYSLSGSIFLDSRNNSDFSDAYSLVYGHHMQGDVMFGSLDNFLEKDYFDNHREGILIVDDKEYKINFFAIVQSHANEDVVFSPLESNGLIDYLTDKSLVFYQPKSGKIIGLSTCVDGVSTLRTILFGTIE